VLSTSADRGSERTYEGIGISNVADMLHELVSIFLFEKRLNRVGFVRFEEGVGSSERSRIRSETLSALAKRSVSSDIARGEKRKLTIPSARDQQRRPSCKESYLLQLEQ